MRSKEAANDYRYFPEPDLQPLVLDEKQINSIKAEMPALPRELFLKYTGELGLSDYDAYNLTDSKGIALYYEEIIRHTKNYKAAANWMMGDVKSYLNEYGVEIDHFPLPATSIAALIQLIDEGKVSTSIASQKIFPEMLKHKDMTPLQLAEEMNLIQDSSEDAILGFINEVIAQHPAEVERYRNGEKQLVGFFMGQLMKVSKGKADPKTANVLMRQTLEK
jgi:aspartyl-tRNA(Asn)/glutamyl-tRNA(Gln) amidotransferase subunit B